MSHSNLIHDLAGKSLSPANPSEAAFAREGELTTEMKDSLITRAKNIIAGRAQPPALDVPLEVEKFLQQEFGEGEQRPTAEALRRISDRLCLEAHFVGRPVACFTTQNGTLAVLASGEQEVEALLRGLSDEEGAKVEVTDSAQF